MTNKRIYIQPAVKAVVMEQSLLDASLPFGEGTKSAEEADAERYGLFDEDAEGMRKANRNCWDDQEDL